MSSQNIRKMVITALLVALTIVFQQLRFVLGDSIVTTYIIGSLVNLCLIVAAVAVGLWSGIAVAVVSPLIAFAQGHLPLLQMLPWVMAGNAVLVVFYALFAVKDKASLTVFWPRWIAAGVVAGVVKFAVIALGQTTVLTSMKGLAFSPRAVGGGIGAVGTADHRRGGAGAERHCASHAPQKGRRQDRLNRILMTNGLPRWREPVYVYNHAIFPACKPSCRVQGVVI